MAYTKATLQPVTEKARSTCPRLDFSCRLENYFINTIFLDS